MKQVIFLADYFVDEVLGGAELSTDVVIQDLISRGFDIQKVKCREFNESLLDYPLVITNFSELSIYAKKIISLKGNYIIIERDQKFVKTRNLTAYKNFIAPKSEIVNKNFYRNAKSVLCLTSKHAELTKINLCLDNIVNIGSTQFSNEQIKMIESNISKDKNGKYAIVNGKLDMVAIEYCKQNNIEYDHFARMDYPSLIQKLSKYTGIVFFSHHFESFCRLLVEAKILGLKIITDNRSGCTYEPWFKISQGKKMSNILRKNVKKSIDIIEDKIRELFNSPKKILFVAGFNEGSTNISQLEALKKLGYEVHSYHYRDDLENVNTVLQSITGFDILLIAKGNTISPQSIKRFKENNNCKTVYWFPDAKCNYTKEMKDKAEACDIVFFDKKNVLELDNRDNYHWVCEGFDSKVDFLHESIEQEIDISFIGDVANWPHRQKMLSGIQDLQIINNVYGTDHAKTVSKTKINLNVCTDDSASDRIYKILAAGGFLLTDDWYGRELTGLVDGKDLVIYKNREDLETKIKFYLNNPNDRIKISKNGYKTVQKLNRLNWAKNITNSFYKS